MPHGGAVPARSHPIANPHAQPYAFPLGKHPELAEYLTEKTEYDLASGCLLWTGGLSKEGTGLSVGRTTVYELMRSGQLDTRKMGRRRLITAESLRRLVEKRD
ncbi:helix-turn-helix domain-containing protein [Erythrobacter sp.]|uniref:helix-turn-helix domain-containing protein n=1 Tax=Erythrobacter sp. TaxID=1042 RepID=UPI0025FB6280|nr:helix-turn-helix domain-containing protein [Erythrobacter sp.]